MGDRVLYLIANSLTKMTDKKKSILVFRIVLFALFNLFYIALYFVPDNIQFFSIEFPILLLSAVILRYSFILVRKGIFWFLVPLILSVIFLGTMLYAFIGQAADG